MLIRAYGLFWEKDEVEFFPGSGKRWDLLGHRGRRASNLRVADFRRQQGLYILYGNHGPHYVGLTKRQGLGKRLKDHMANDHAGHWERFSWFGFCRVTKQFDAQGLSKLASRLAESAVGSPSEIISDTEALLIHALGLPSNLRHTRFAKAEEWSQVKRHERDLLLGRLGG